MSRSQETHPRAPDARLESVIANGDLSKLSVDERVEYYNRVCEATGLNPLTQPFAYLTLQGRLVLYARKDATDQLRMIHKISVVDMAESERDGVLTVTVKVQSADGRTDMDKGAVRTEGLKGDALANAIMKAATKAKRRATLSICGLGLLDETEVETIPDAIPHGVAAGGASASPSLPTPRQRNSSALLKKSAVWDSFTDKLQHYMDSRDLDGLKAWFASDALQERIAAWPETWREQAEEEFEKAHDAITAREH